MEKELQTPVMRQYLEIKSKYPDFIVFFRLGDFYEMFMDDAIEASKILDIALTKRQNSIPMAGIPYHSTESYISKLLQAGKKIVICEQVKPDDPKAKLMPREVVRIITPGTVIEENLLDGYKNNYLCVLIFTEQLIFTCFADVSTSEMYYFNFEPNDLGGLKETFFKFSPKEVLLPGEQLDKWNTYFPKGTLPHHPIVSPFNEHIENSTKNGYETLKHLLDCYLKLNYRENSFSFEQQNYVQTNEYLILDEQTISSLELIENDKNKEHTLFHILNFCKTPAGKRELRRNILFPTRSKDKIKYRWKAIECLDSKQILSKVAENLNKVGDLERILTRFRGNKAFPRDFQNILNTLKAYQTLNETLSNILDFQEGNSKSIELVVNSLPEFIESRIVEEDLPVYLGNGKFIKDGFNSELDHARLAKEKGKDWILGLEEKEKKETGLNTLKIRYNKILGYYFEVSRLQAKNLPSKYVKKQTLVTTERFTTSELEELERTILEADEKINEIEKREFDLLVKEVLKYENQLRLLARALANLDFIYSLVLAKDTHKWTKPQFSINRELYLKDSRHPVVERFLPLGETFISNSIHLDSKDESIAILTGPNMAGKSTFMRQIALNQILFQIGSYVPAKEAKLPIVDRIFTRIGAGDNLTGGESTFFVEMKETAHILHHMSEDSLILFDEVGRGTSTYDGISLAWAILEYLSEREIRTKTIFATHYHELTELEKGNGIFNLYMDTYEKDGNILFLKKVKRGKSKKSFGIYVAKLAGIPFKIIKRAEEILEGLESKKKEIRIRQEEPSLFPNFQGEPDKQAIALERIRKRLLTLQIDKTTPLEALQILDELQRWAKE